MITIETMSLKLMRAVPLTKSGRGQTDLKIKKDSPSFCELLYFYECNIASCHVMFSLISCLTSVLHLFRKSFFVVQLVFIFKDTKIFKSFKATSPPSPISGFGPNFANPLQK